MEDIFELMRSRHSVRRYKNEPIPADLRQKLGEYCERLNAESGLSIQIIYDEPECFSSRMAHYGHFENCSNYIAIVGDKSPDLDEKCGYYGELLVLEAQRLGLNTCWVALTHGKSKAVVKKGQSESIIISLGYGVNGGHERKSKQPAEVSRSYDGAPQWFRRGVEAALLAPTATNQQKFSFELSGDTVEAKTPLVGVCLKTDLGIVKCHFELGAGKDNFKWRQ